MSEEQDSRTATMGRKRALDHTPVYNLVTSSDSSDGEPTHKRLKQISKAVPVRGARRTNLPLDAGEQKDYISLLDSDDQDAEDALIELGYVSQVKAAEHSTASDLYKLSNGQHDADNFASDELTARVNVHNKKDDYAGDEFVSAAAGSIKAQVPAARGNAESDSIAEKILADAATTFPNQGRKDEEIPIGISDGSRVDAATHHASTLPVNIVRNPGAADRMAMAEGRRIQIGRLPEEATAEDILEFFKDYEVDSVYIPLHYVTNQAVGIGYVCLPSAVDAKKAIAALNGKQVQGRKVFLNLSQTMGSAKVFPAANDSDMIDGGDKTIPQATLSKIIPDQPTTVGNGPDGKTRDVKDGQSRRNRKTVLTAKQRMEERLHTAYGDEYIAAVQVACTRKSVYPIPLPFDRRVFKVGRQIIHHPEMVENDSPIPLSQLTLTAFIPLLLRANPEQGAFFLVKPQRVIDAFRECVNVQYRSNTTKKRKEAVKTATEHADAAIFRQIADLMSKSPDILKGLRDSPEYEKYPPPLKKEILRVLKEQKQNILKAPIASCDAEESEKTKPALDSKIPTSRQELAFVANTEPPKKIGFHAKLGSEGSSELPLRYVSDHEESNLLLQDPALDHDMHIQQNELQSFNDAKDDELQMRYFPSSEHSSGPHCLKCGVLGHPTSACSPVTCESCGHPEVHYTWACPQKLRCERCREMGHRARSCPEKLKRSISENIECETCGSLDHVESTCHQVWRSYVVPEATRKVAGLVINCFACGSATHFGMNCALRAKKRVGASSTFSMDNAQQYIDPTSNLRSLSAGKDYSIKAKTKNKPKEFSIRGRAKQDPINLDSDSDDGDFLRPPAKKIQSGQGHIQINQRNTNLGRFQKPLPSTSQNFPREPLTQAYQPQYTHDRGRSPPIYRDFRDDAGRGNSNSHYDPPNHHYWKGGPRPVDRYESRFDAPYERDVGFLRGGNISRGGDTSRGGNTSIRNRKLARRGPRGRGS